MSPPQKHPKTEVYYFREKVPTDLRSAFGKVEVSRTLGTKDPAEAKTRHAEEKRKQALIWQTMRAKPESLPHKTVVALAGVYYREQIAGHEVDPGDPEGWDEMGDVIVDAAENMAQAERLHGEDADRLLREAGLTTDAESRSRLIDAMNVAYYQAAQALRRMAEGDYRPDPQAGRFPEPPARAAETPNEKPTLTGIFALWEREHLANSKSKKTAADFRHKLDSLREFVGHDDAERVTTEDIVQWTDRLRFKDGLSPRTVSNKYLGSRLVTASRR